MPNFKDITGQRFGRLIALEQRGSIDGHVLWMCHCDCGASPICRYGNLIHENTKSCGCLKHDTAATLKHGHKRHGQRTPTYNSWRGMLARCGNPRNNRYINYGARGIVVCERWLRFENFLTDMGERPCGLSIDRIDNNGNYEPGNCRWATASQQTANQRKRQSSPRLARVSRDRSVDAS